MRTHAAAEVLLDRHGIVTRGAVVAEGTPGGFAAVYRVLSAMEETGRIRRGYFVEGLGAAQFATAGAVDRVRAFAQSAGRRTGGPAGVVLAAADPANPYGAALPWPTTAGRPARTPTARRPRTATVSPPQCRRDPADRHRPARPGRARLTVLVDGDGRAVRRTRRAVAADVHRAIPRVLAAAAEALAERVRSGRIGSLTITKIDGADALTLGRAGGRCADRRRLQHDPARAASCARPDAG